MRTITVLADGKYELTEVEVPEETFSDHAHKVVGGYFEVVHLPKVGVDLWINEEGKYTQVPSNEWATAAAFHGGAGLAYTDFIMGNVVVTGGVDATGNALGLTDDQVTWLQRKVII